MAITEKLRKEKAVDYLMVLETSALEQIAGMYAQENGNHPGIYGIGNSIKCVYYLDEAVVEGLVAADGYDMGYQSVLEISGALKNQLYTMKTVRRIIGCCIRRIFSGKRYSSFFIRMINHISKRCDNPTICEYWVGLWKCVARSNP